MNNIDELERHLDLLNEVLNSDNESDANEDELYERRIEVRRRMVQFYRQRADILIYLTIIKFTKYLDSIKLLFGISKVFSIYIITSLKLQYIQCINSCIR